MAAIGALQFDGRQWAPNLKISGMHAPAEEFTIDPLLPVQGVDPRYPSVDRIAIPRGRILAMRADTTSYTGKACLTIADGSTNLPCGYARSSYFREEYDRINYNAFVTRQDFIEVPYVAAVNGAYGTLSGGDKITAYYGSANALVGAPQDKGKLVKWIPKTLYMFQQSAAATAAPTQAVLPAFAPVLVAAWAGTAMLANTALTGTVYTTGQWTFRFNVATITAVLFTYGQNYNQVAGEVVRIEPISSSHHLPGWLEWVTDNFSAWEFPPMEMRVPTTAVVTETPVTIDAYNYQLANKGIARWRPVTVLLTGTIVSMDGLTTTTYTGTAMSTAGLPFVDNTMGQDYNINPITGILSVSNRVTVTSMTVSYEYETKYADGRIFNQGIIGLTDGRYSGVPGTPANLETLGVAGSLRAIIY